MSKSIVLKLALSRWLRFSRKHVQGLLVVIGLFFASPGSAQYTITVGGVSPTYTQLRLALNAISLGTYTGAVHVQIKGNTVETMKGSLTPHPLVDSVMIYPTAAAVIQGNLNDDLIELVGTHHVYIDGRIHRTGSVKSLTITNTNTGSSAYVYCFKNATTFSSLSHVVMKGNGKGVIRFVHTTISGTVGNSDNVIERSLICDGTSTPQYGIYSEGGFNRVNARNKVRYNEICNYYNNTNHSNGIYLYDYNSDWQIIGNSFYQTAPRISSTWNTAIKEYPNNQSYLYPHQILDNFIGGSEDSCGGVTSIISTFVGIDVVASGSLLTTVSNNRIRNLTAMSGFRGIQIGYGKVLVNNNFVGDSVGNGSIQVAAGFAEGIVVTQNDSVKVYNNKIGAITASCNITGIDVLNVFVLSAVTVTGNLVGSRVTPNSISSNATGTTTIVGIRNVNTNGVIDRNVILNMSGTNPTGANCGLYGILNQSGYTRGNEIGYLRSLTQGITYASCIGISTFEAKDNFVHHLEAFTEYYNVWGMSAYVAVNNIISLGFGITSSAQFFGIYGNTGSQAGYFHNTISLGGVSTTTNICAGLFGGYQANSNIFYCVRTNAATGPGANYCVFNIGGAVANCFYAAGAGNAVAWSAGITYSSWGTGIYANPMFGSLGGHLAFHHKPGIVLNGTAAYGGFVLSVPNDYFGFSRPNPPTMGAIEKTTCVAIPHTRSVITCTSYSLGSQTYSASGTYTQFVTDPGGCDTLMTIQLQVGPPVVTVTPSFTSTCAGNNFTLTATGAVGYTWSTPASPTTAAIVVNPSSTTVYTVIASNSPGCAASYTVQTVVDPLPLVTLPGGQICIGDSFTLNPSGALTYTYVPGGPIVTPVVTTTYAVKGADANGCVGVDTIQVMVNSMPVLSVNHGSVCLGQVYTLTPTGAVSYSFPGGGPQVSPVNNATYVINGTDANGCSASIVASVGVLPLPTVSINSGAVCLGSPFTLQPSGGVNYIYHNGGPVVSPIVTSVFSVTSVNANGCLSASKALAHVTVIPLPSINIAPATTVICEGEGVNLVANGANTFTWNSNIYSTYITVTPPIGSNIYQVSGTDNHTGCVGSASVAVIVDPCSGVAETRQPTCVIFPNPTTEWVTIRGPIKTLVELADLSGRVLHLDVLRDDTLDLSLNGLASGMYVLTLHGDYFYKQYQVIKQ